MTRIKSRTLATYSSISATDQGVSIGTRIVDGPDAHTDGVTCGRPAYMSLSPDEAVSLARLLVEYAARSLNSRDHGTGTLRSPTCDYSHAYDGGEWGDVCVLPYPHEGDHLYRSMLLNLPESLTGALQ